MSILHVSQIRGVLERTFKDHIDLNDVANEPEANKKKRFLSRGLAAFALCQFADIQPSAAAAAVTDGKDDNGIDAIYYDTTNKILFVIQAKWRDQGNGSLDVAETNKAVNGFRDLVREEFDRFNAKIRAFQQTVENALTTEKSTYKLILVHTGQNELEEHSQRLIDDCLEEFNNFKSDAASDLLEIKVLRQKDLYNFITKGIQGDPIDLEVSVEHWGKIDEPFAVYGQVLAAHVAEWWNKYYPRIVEHNIRKFLGADGEVNSGLHQTLLGEPEKFWHHNNGITVICQRITRKMMGAHNRDSAYLVCHGASIVNGAQTAGSIAAAYDKNPDQAAKARVLARFIEVGGDGSSEFGVSITRATNTQNRISRQDFVSLDPEQDRLRRELAVEGVTYSFKSGDAGGRDETSFDLDEATVALACAHKDLTYSTMAKREAGKLWDQSGKAPPYKALFNPGTSSATLWRNVQVYRLIEAALNERKQMLDGRDKGYAVHGSRFVTHHVFQALPQQKNTFDRLSPEEEQAVQEAVSDVLGRTIGCGNRLYPAAYLAPLFNSPTKTAELGRAMRGEAPQATSD